MVRDEFGFSVANTPPTRRQRQVALGVVGVLFVCFAAIAPFAATPLLRFDSFYPTVDAIVFVTDLTTAVLLFNQFAIVRAPELLILASGYLFSGLIVVSHALTFPGAFTPTGLLGAGIQSTPWLFTFWHFGFSAAVLCYACLKDRSRAESAIQHSAAPAIYRGVIIVVSLVCALTLAVTAGEEFVPRLFLSEVQFAPLANYVTVVTFFNERARAGAVVDSRPLGTGSMGYGCYRSNGHRANHNGFPHFEPLQPGILCRRRIFGHRLYNCVAGVALGNCHSVCEALIYNQKASE
jgi:hypothetical protein